MNLESLIRRDGEHQHPVVRQGDALVIDCRSCRLAPVPGSDECIRCMVEAMSSAGGAERIVLRTGRDIEVSGAACRAVREVASIRRWSTSGSSGGARCRTCPVSAPSVMAAVWGAFPRSAVFEGRKVLKDGQPERDECRACVMRTSRSLDRIESELKRVVADMDTRGRVPP